MKLRLSIFILLIVLSGPGLAQSSGRYQYTLDLTNVKKDRLYVELIPPPISAAEVTFYFPKIIPGTYAIEDYGRYITRFECTDRRGKKLTTAKTDVNGWKISNASQLARITYWVDDSFDSEIDGPDIFWPAKTNIEDGKNFIINTCGFFGYFDGMKKLPVEFTIIHPVDFYGTTGLIPTAVNEPVDKGSSSSPGGSAISRKDVFTAGDYDQLVDSPLMYAHPDTAVVHVANADVIVGAYSPRGLVHAREIAASIREVLEAQKEFLGGKLPVDKYAFIFYFTDQPVTRYGALEHSYSSLYYMPEMTIDAMGQQLRDFAAHEFFHIVTPLTVHSEEIGHFDFNNPKMSKHLWMYEGVTEYFAGLVQVQYGLIDGDQYLDMLREKMVYADTYNDTLSFTDLSKYTLDKYSDQYDNVYQKGALIGMCVDLELLRLSGGTYHLRDLLLELSRKFGKSMAFQDDQLFDIIAEMTYPEIRTFFANHVEGAEPLPLEVLLDQVGIQYLGERTYQTYSLGVDENVLNVTEIDHKSYLYIEGAEALNEMGKALGLQEGDLLVRMNDRQLPDLGPEFGAFIQEQVASLPSLDTLSIGVLRKDKKGRYQEVRLAAKNQQVDVTARHILRFNPDATEEQAALQKAWLNREQ